jgi:hypothetical protein
VVSTGKNEEMGIVELKISGILDFNQFFGSLYGLNYF